MADQDKINRKPSEFDPFPGQPLSRTDRAVQVGRDMARVAGQHVPPVARPHNGWERR